MKKIIILSSLLLLFLSCNKNENKKNDLQLTKTVSVISDSEIENKAKLYKSKIDDLIKDKKLTLCKYLKLSNQDELQLYDNQVNYYDSIEEEFDVYCENRQVVYIQSSNLGEDINTFKNYYFNVNDYKTCVIQNIEINLSEPSSHETIYTVIFNDNFNKISETFETKDEEGKIISKKKFKTYALEQYKSLSDILSDLGLYKNNKLEKDIALKSYENLKETNEGNNTITRKDVELILSEASFEKVELLLGMPDEYSKDWSSYSSKGCVLYYNKVKDESGSIKNLVLSVVNPESGMSYGKKSFIVKRIYAVDDVKKTQFWDTF